MPVRYPPNQMPPGQVSRDPRTGRLVTYVEPKKGLGRRILRRLFRDPVIIPVVFISALALGILI